MAVILHVCTVLRKIVARQIHSGTHLIDMADEISDRNEKSFNDNVEVQPSPNVVIEGQAKIQFSGAQDVFYNPVQEFNRDLSIAVLREFALRQVKSLSREVVGETYLKPGEIYENGITILEALGASGLRSIRYAKEIGGIKKIITNDLSSKAVESIQKNSMLNSVEHLITPSEGDASLIMYQHRHKSSFNCVDIDPYGSPSPFIDAAVQCVADGGLLMVTATDMAILCGNEPETCYSKYATISLKNKACHEMALRILLTNLSTAAARYGRYVHPLLSVSVDFYVRIFVLVFTSKKECKSTASKLSMAYQCVQCHTIYWQPLMNTVETNNGSRNIRAHGPPTSSECEFCHGRLLLGGPFYSQPIHDLDFVQSILCSLDNPENGALKTEKRIRGVLSVIEEELPDVPFYYVLDYLASLVKLSVPSLVDFRSAILNAGYRVSFSHANPLSIKTDAPPSVIWDLLQGFAKKQFPNKTWPRPLPDKPLAIDYLLGRSVVVEADFTLHPDANPNSRKQKLTRFQTNPEKNWGPKARAKSGGNETARKVSSRKKRRIETQST